MTQDEFQKFVNVNYVALLKITKGIVSSTTLIADDVLHEAIEYQMAHADKLTGQTHRSIIGSMRTLLQWTKIHHMRTKKWGYNDDSLTTYPGEGEDSDKTKRSKDIELKLSYNPTISISVQYDIRQAIKVLPDEEGRITTLLMEGYTFNEIAHLIGRPDGTVKWLWRTRIRPWLQDLLAGYRPHT